MNDKYLDVSLHPHERAEALLENLNLDEKIAQINCIFPFDKNYDDLEFINTQTKCGIGQVSTLEMRRMKTLEEVVDWQKKIQEIVMSNSEFHIPAIFHMEGLCGAFIQGATSFPSGIGRGAGWNPDLEEKIAEIVSRQEVACGITHIFAPVLDISRDSRMGRQGETYGEDPALASAMGVAYTRGIQNQEIAGRKSESVAKHFLAFHNSQGGIHGTYSDTPSRVLEEIYAKPFQAAIIESDLRGVMPCYSSINGEPVSTSKSILTKLLRDEMAFDGVCVSDYGAIGIAHERQHIGETMKETGRISIEAGMDMELPNSNAFGVKFKELYSKEEADLSYLDKAVTRVLEAKFRMGLFESPFALQGEVLKKVFNDNRDIEVSLQSAKESIVLLKNKGVLPLTGNERKIALIGPHANCARKFFGGYTHLCMMESTFAIENSIAGVSGIENNSNKKIITIPGTNIQSDETEEFDMILKRQKPECKSLLEKMIEKLPTTEIVYSYGYPIAGNDTSNFMEAIKTAEEADVIILTLGGKHGTCSVASMGEGIDSSNINLPSCQDKFIKLASKLGKPLIGIHFDGRPISSDIADMYLDGIIEAWNPSEMGAEAIVSILMGDYNPGGKLPLTVAYHSGQLPIYYNHPNGSAWHQGGSIGFANYVDLPHTPRYYFGHGLSYTEFVYSNLKIINPQITSEESVVIEIEITNAGEMAGDEVVQLYLIDIFASMVRPVKELAGFKRIMLNPKEKRKIIFEVCASQMAFLDDNMKWKIEEGLIGVEVGSSSEDIRLSGQFEIINSNWILGKERSFYAKTKTI